MIAAMDVDEFWGTIESARTAVPRGQVEQQMDELRAVLAQWTAGDLHDAWTHLRAAIGQAHTWDLWAAGYLAAGGMSDDAFEAFLSWLVLQGRADFEATLADPDHLDDLTWAADGSSFRGPDLRAPARLGRSTLGPHPFGRLWEPELVGALAPVVAAYLFERGEIRLADRPMVAAYWLAANLGGDAVLELASLRGNEAEVGELWPVALAEVGVDHPADGVRAAAGWGAGIVLAGEGDLRWLTALLWPTRAHEDTDISELVYVVDDTLDWTGGAQRARDPDVRARARSARAAVDRAIRSLHDAHGDPTGANAILAAWPG